MSMSVDRDKIISIFNEPGYIIFEIQGVKMKLPVVGTVDEIHDTSKEFLTDLFSIIGVEEVLNKHGVIIEQTVT